jgi:hypothetical protein
MNWTNLINNDKSSAAAREVRAGQKIRIGGARFERKKAKAFRASLLHLSSA